MTGRYRVPCGHWSDALARLCAAVPTCLFVSGARCRLHTPAALKGQPEPGEGASCPPSRCYCRQCPSWQADSAHTAQADAFKAVDARAIRSGKRRSNAATFAAARAAVDGGPR